MLQPAPEGLRLPRTARPLGYRLALDVDPANETFAGRVVIDVELDEAAHPLWLNATNLTIDSARILPRDAGTERPLRVVPGGPDVIGLAADTPFGPGRVQIEIVYRGVQNDRQSDGIIRRADAGDWYLITDLEPLGARRILPSFDEPAFKVPWQLELTVPAATLAASNTPIESDVQLDDGRRRITFAPTPPMPSYLFAFAVGPFDAVDAGATRKGVPMRILVPRGRSADAAFMARESGRIIAALEDYTGIDFPYAKLDHVVVPGSPGGAMENVGLITYAPEFLLIPEREGDDLRRIALWFMAHEVAHQWFGNLVTLAWWDDIWLNEAFSNWAADRVMTGLYEAYDNGLVASAGRWLALDGEANPGVRAVREPIVQVSDIDRAFDSITYDKGATILHMYEQVLGVEVMRDGVRTYLERHRWRTATAADFIAALSEAAGRDLAPSLAPWLDRPGAPLVSMSVTCKPGQPAVVELAQRRIPVVGLANDDTMIWPTPVCVRVPGEAKPRCTELAGQTGRIQLGERCPSFVVPTGRGHFQTELSPPLRAALVRDWTRLDAVEQAAIVTDTAALVEAGRLAPGAMLELLPKIGRSQNRIAIQAAVIAIQRYDLVVEPTERPRFEREIQRSFGKLARATGWKPRPGEAVLPGVLRRTLVPAVAVIGRDDRLNRDARELTRRWLTDRSVLGSEERNAVLRAGIASDDGALFDQMLALVMAEPDIAVRRAMARALGQTNDPARLRRAFETLTSPSTVAPEMLGAFSGARTPALTEVALAFLEQQLPQLLEKVPADWHGAIMPWTCHASQRERVAVILDAHFVALRDVGKAGRDRQLARMDACIAESDALRASLRTYLRSR
ncbi:MAG: M1 family metallopeptidase [Deltaproteobacteria bacterium]|nr:M1 family metallopeptidase [Kofleriaceae bacterium]